ncbi:VCBS domain-containing protein, partial [Vibrio parahaemolyticus]
VDGNTLANDTAFDGPVSFDGWQGNIAAQYGTFTANADGTYRYVLDNANPAVNALNDDQTLTETFTYQVKDADGDVATATVVITINGHTDGSPTVTTPEGNGAEAGQHTLAEDDTAGVSGTFTVTAEAGLSSVKVGGETLTLAQLNGLSSTTPVTVETPRGTLVLNGFDAATGKVSYHYTVDGAQEHAKPDNDATVLDDIAIVVTDALNGTGNGTLTIAITDTVPVATGESHTLVEDSGSY